MTVRRLKTEKYRTTYGMETFEGVIVGGVNEREMKMVDDRRETDKSP